METSRKPNDEPIPGYRLIEPLGSGGFGEVWKCEAPGGLHKAIKIIYGNLNSLDMDGARAEQELAALQEIKRVRHPFVCSTEQIQIVQGEVIIVMELADKSLHDALLEYQASGLIGIPRDTLLRYVRDSAEALDHMNEKYNLQHLDIKPRNLFLVSERVKVADFGLVMQLERQSESGMLGGITPLYASPETFSGKITEFSDQYSLAIVYHELLTGQRPFNGKNVRQLAQQHLTEEPELRALPEADRPIVARALSKDPPKRFPNCMAFVRALYNAQGRARSDPVIIVDEGKGGQRPKTLAETLEDFQLEEPISPSLSDFSSIDHPLADTKTPLKEQPADASVLGLTVAQPESGALRPTLIIGVGSFGRRALQELRCLILDRLGDLKKISLVRFLYVDPDPEAIQNALRGPPELAFSRNEVYHLPVHPPSHYRKRMLEHVTEWLPREKLYTIPRSLQPQGSRAIGRLAFVDSQQRFLARLKAEVQRICHPDVIYHSVSQTGLALRDNVPRVYVLAGSGGGSSGLLPDLGYALRRVLQHLRHDEKEASLFLYCGAPADPSTPKLEQANTYATVTELNHYCDPSVPFTAQYVAEGPRISSQGSSFARTYLMQRLARDSNAFRDSIGHLANYLFHELTTPLGIRLDRCRKQQLTPDTTSFRSFGTYSIWFPRGLLLRLAARHACCDLLEGWSSGDESLVSKEGEAACARIQADADLRPESLTLRLERETSPNLGAAPGEALAALLASLEEQAQQATAQEDPGAWAHQALVRVRELVGNGVQRDTAGMSGAGEWKKSRVNRSLQAAAEKLAQEWDQKLGKIFQGLMEHPGKRIATTEVALNRCIRDFKETLGMYQVRGEQVALRTQQARQQVEAALQGCTSGTGGGWGISSLLFFGNRARRMLRVFTDHLSAYSRLCLNEEVIAAGQRFFVLLNGKLEDRLREMTFCRQRLRHLLAKLQEKEIHGTAEGDTSFPSLALAMAQSSLPSTTKFWEAIRNATTVRVVLPDGETDLEKASLKFTGTLASEQRTELDQALQDRVLAHQGGLFKACSGSGDIVRSLGLPMIEQSASFLDQHLPTTDVAEVMFTSTEAEHQDVPSRIQKFLHRSGPLVPGRPEGRETFVLIPASEPGKAFGAEVEKIAPRSHLVRVPGQAHLMFCCEQGPLMAEEVRKFFRMFKSAYEETSAQPQTSPHARFDVLDWIPLDP